MDTQSRRPGLLRGKVSRARAFCESVTRPRLSKQSPLHRKPTSVTDALTDDVLRANARDSEFFSLVYRTYASQVLGYLTARGVEDPEAVMQDVFLAVLPRLETVSGGVQGLRTFIFSVAHARMVDDHRRQSRAPAKLPFDAELDLREESSAEAEALERVSPSEVLGLLQGLLDEQKEVLTLRIIGGLTVDQVAAVMGKSPGAVKQLQRRALNRLREETSVKEYVAP